MAIPALTCRARRAATSELICACVGRATLLPIRTEVCRPTPAGTLGVTAEVSRNAAPAATSRANSPAIRAVLRAEANRSAGHRANVDSRAMGALIELRPG